MSDGDKKKLNFNKAAGNENATASHVIAPAESLEDDSAEDARREPGRSLGLLSRVRRLVSLRADQVRLTAARLTEAQDELVHVVGAVKDLARTAAGLTRETQFLSITAGDIRQPPAQAVILLAGVVKEICGFSRTVKATIESQIITMRKLTEIVGETALVSTHLTGRVSALAEETRTVMPPLSSKNLVDAELQWLTAELEKALTELRSPQTATKAGIDDVTPQLLAKPQVVN